MNPGNKFLFIFGVALLAVRCEAYPIPFRSLRELFGDAEVVVVAEVMKVEAAKPEKGNFEDSIATLRTIQALKGKVDGNLVVSFFPYMICPSPARYEEGDTVLAFLRYSHEKQAHVTCSLSYGAKHLSPEGLQSYLNRIRELTTILEIEDEEEQIRATTDWLVTCAVDPATIQEGSIELQPVPRDQSQHESKEHPAYWKHLTNEHEKKIVAFLETMEPGRVGMHPAALTFMKLIGRRLDDEDLTELIGNYRSIDYHDREKPRKQRVILKEFLSKYRFKSNFPDDIWPKDVNLKLPYPPIE